MAHVDEVRLLTIPEASNLLGICRQHLYELAKIDPAFPPLIKLGKASRIRLRDLLEWLDAKSVAAQAARERRVKPIEGASHRQIVDQNPRNLQRARVQSN